MTLFTCLIEERDKREPFVQVYWAYADHLGEAINMMLAAAKENGLKDHLPRQCDPYDIENLPDEIEPSSEDSVFWATVQHTYPPEEVFDLPIGIIASCIEGDFDIDEIERGHTISKGNDGLTIINVNVENDNLFTLYSEIIDLFPKYRVFWYVLHDHWDNEFNNQFFVKESLDTPELILSHLTDNYLNSIQNGFVTLTAYLDEGATNIDITDHKRISIKTRSDSVVHKCLRRLDTSGYTERKSLVSIDDRIHHWHYRVPGSYSKNELKVFLKEHGFFVWDPNG